MKGVEVEERSSVVKARTPYIIKTSRLKRNPRIIREKDTRNEERNEENR